MIHSRGKRKVICGLISHRVVRCKWDVRARSRDCRIPPRMRPTAVGGILTDPSAIVPMTSAVALM